MTFPGIRTARLAGFMLGAAVASVLVLASLPASGGEAVGASVSFSAGQTGELAVEPPAPADFLHVAELRPGASASGGFEVRNQTGRPRAVRLLPVASSHELDRDLTVRLSSDGRTLASGPLGSQAWEDGDPLVLAPGESAHLEVSVSLARGTEPEVAAALVEVAVGFESGAPETNGGIAR